MPRFDAGLIADPGRRPGDDVARIWREFRAEFEQYLHLPERRLPSNYDPAHAFAVLFQLHRAFTSIFEWLIGRSMPIAQLRAAVWQSIFSHDMRRYARTLYRSLGDIPTLVLGPSGTGKELVALAIGHARFIPFEARTESFTVESLTDFHPVNLSALSPTLIESELFGHRKGAFTGAMVDRVGWLETCGAAGTVFLDEIGELDVSLQVKLLRVLQSRIFQRVGEIGQREFRGKIVAATNRDLAVEIREGRFREDLYYRLCADIVQTPTLRDQLADSPDDLPHLVQFLAQRIITDDPTEAAILADEVVDWITKHLDKDYAWPGNIRELEQCVRNVMIRGSYRPSPAAVAGVPTTVRQKLSADMLVGHLTMDELMQHYASLAFALDGSYVAAANRLRINWRTVRDKVQPDLVARYQADKSL